MQKLLPLTMALIFLALTSNPVCAMDSKKEASTVKAVSNQQQSPHKKKGKKKKSHTTQTNIDGSEKKKH